MIVGQKGYYLMVINWRELSKAYSDSSWPPGIGQDLVVSYVSYDLLLEREVREFFYGLFQGERLEV
jgi:hypothetical protein